MPTYDFRCDDCEHTFEEFFKTFKVADRKSPKIVCPECGGKTKRLISGGAGVKFIGPGFYATDYGVNDRIMKHIEKDPENRGDGSGRMLGDNP